MDAILVKTLQVAYLVPELKETFSTLWKYNMGLNLEKYIFSVRKGKFLGYTMTERRIKANPKKIKVV